MILAFIWATKDFQKSYLADLKNGRLLFTGNILLVSLAERQHRLVGGVRECDLEETTKFGGKRNLCHLENVILRPQQNAQ